MQTFELAILDGIQTLFRCSFLDWFMPAVSSLGNNGWIWILLTVLLMLYPKTRKTGAVLALALSLELLCCNGILKPLIDRVRPCAVRDFSPFIAPPQDASFPSGHTAASFAAVGGLHASGSRLWKPALVLAILIGVSRLYLYVHWPSDVLAGAVLGYGLGWLARWILFSAWGIGKQGSR